MYESEYTSIINKSEKKGVGLRGEKKTGNGLKEAKSLFFYLGVDLKLSPLKVKATFHLLVVVKMTMAESAKSLITTATTK